MVRTSEYVKLRILLFYQRNVKICHAVHELSLEGIKRTKRTVSKYYKRFGREITLCELPRSGRPSTLERQHYDFIDAKMEENDELTAVRQST